MAGRQATSHVAREHHHRGIGRPQGRRRQCRRIWPGDHHAGAFLQQIRRRQQGRHAGQLIRLAAECPQRRLRARPPAGSPVRWNSRASTSAIMPLPEGVALSAAVRGRRQRHVRRIGGGGEEPAMPVGERRLRRLRQPFGGRQVSRLAGRLVQSEGGTRHRRLVLDQTRCGDPAEPPGMLDPAMSGGIWVRMKSNASRARSSQAGWSNTDGAAGQRGDRQAVPVGQHLVVPPRPHPLFARLEQHIPGVAPAPPPDPASRTARPGAGWCAPPSCPPRSRRRPA